MQVFRMCCDIKQVHVHLQKHGFACCLYLWQELNAVFGGTILVEEEDGKYQK